MGALPAVAEAFSDIDGLLVAVETLITKKQATMEQLLSGKGMMQQLPTGCVRLVERETLTERTAAA